MVLCDSRGIRRVRWSCAIREAFGAKDGLSEIGGSIGAKDGLSAMGESFGERQILVQWREAEPSVGLFFTGSGAVLLGADAQGVPPSIGSNVSKAVKAPPPRGVPSIGSELFSKLFKAVKAPPPGRSPKRCARPNDAIGMSETL